MAGVSYIAWDCRDQVDRATLLYQEGEKRRKIEEENQKLKRLLREHGICWSPAVAHRSDFFGGSSEVKLSARDRATRAATRARTAAARAAGKGARLPTEIFLRIIELAMTSSGPIIDPLTKPHHLSITASEARAGSGIAIGLMAVSRAFNVEATKILWSRNTFTFTTPEALLGMANLSLEIRSQIKHINLRIIARFYKDDSPHLSLSKREHPNLPRALNLPINERPKGHSGAIGGLRSYAWLQVVDFLAALLPPFQPQPQPKDKKRKRGSDLDQRAPLPRPRLLPNLDKMRIDLVNFPQRMLRNLPGNDLHQIAAHELACTLSELTVTGFPCCAVGIRAASDVSEMLRDNGLFVDGGVVYMQQRGSRVDKVKKPPAIACRVVRPRLPVAKKASNGNAGSEDELPSDSDLLGDDWQPLDAHHHHHSNDDYDPSPVPVETKGERSCWEEGIIWKQVPTSLVSGQARRWVEFESERGFALEDIKWEDSDDDEDELRVECKKCGKVHFDPLFDSD
ncbi:hypothetical protein MAPG_04301 [Magnaporthiopsis poae ATCC 64411]|uniref:Uncharacterized protein n=1 Tax=Magnaporthiopsis poae (strain ATCC 64411 / 73-15) TaxID=644358 RepID=A0A0C4DWC5_MAGP6|nr:hypothetical protein MAPG_04301 [Magnaporthiopsis poae ATCC 64411]